MRTLTDSELLRIAGFDSNEKGPPRPGDTVRAAKLVGSLRRSIALLPTMPFADPAPECWQKFATAVVIALCGSLREPNGYVLATTAESLIGQLAGLLVGTHFEPGELYRLIDRTADKHWLEGRNRGHDEAEYRPTMLGESIVESAATSPAGHRTIGANKVYRLKEFRNILNVFLAPMFAANGDQNDAKLDAHAAVQDAWVDLGDVIGAESADKVDRILQTVIALVPDHPFEVWRDAQRQVAELIIGIGQAEKRNEVAVSRRVAMMRANSPAYATGLVMKEVFDGRFANRAAVNQKAVSQTEVVPKVESIATMAPRPTYAICYVTREQASALVKVSKDTIERWFRDDPDAPSPEIEGGGGKAHKYDYSKLRPWLERQSGMRLPEQLPELR